MIDLYFAPTPNGMKIKLFMEESGIEYKTIPIDLKKGEQFKPEFLAISPNNKIPAIVDHQPSSGIEKLHVFESGAILLYLSHKIGKFMPTGFRESEEAIQWLFWQAGGLAPMASQLFYFSVYADQKVPYTIDRFDKEVTRLLGVLDKHLADREFISSEYSIADMSCYPWIVSYKAMGKSIDNFPHLKRWADAIERRPAVKRAYG
jgi:Glutathione S-transferase